MKNLGLVVSIVFFGVVSCLNAAVHEMFPQEEGRGIVQQAAAPGPAVLRSRVVPQAQRPALPAVAGQAAYPFFADIAFTTTVTRVSRGFGNAQIVEGTTADTSVKSLTVYTPGGVRHEIYGTTNGHVYVAASLPDGMMVMREFDPSLEPCHCGNDDDHLHAPDLDPQIAQVAADRALQAADDVEVDLMMVFDIPAATWANANAGGTEAFALAAVTRMNTVLANSGIACAMRLVDVYLPNHTASGGTSAELPNVQSGAGGWSGIAARRTTVGADMVSVMIDTGSATGTTGTGYVGGSEAWMFSTCAVRAVNTGQTMTHEIGHNFGCGHSWTLNGGASQHPYDYGAGLNFIGTNGTRYHTIMAYYYDDNFSGYTPCNLFSSPFLTFQGVTIGDPATADNARVIRERMATVAGFRLPAGVMVTFDPMLGTVDPATIRYLLNETYGTLPTPVRTGYRFDGWATAIGTPVGPTDTVASTDHTLYAQWTPTGVAVIVQFDAQGGTVTPATKTIYSGTTYDTLPVATQPGYLFAGWYTASNGGGTQILSTTLITATANHTLYAKWMPVAPGVIVYYVDGASGSDSAPGTTPAAPKKTIQAAIDIADTGDAILVFDGVYAPITTANKAILIQSVNGAERVIIDGGDAQRCATLATADTDTATTLTGFTLRNGRAFNSNGGGSYGGTLNRCRLINNRATNWGGGSYYGIANNCLYANNTAFYGGGSMYTHHNNSTIINNTATDTTAAGGGTWAGTIRNSIIWDNTSGGALNNYASGSLAYTCTTPRPNGTGNTDAAPLFADADGRLADASPCKNAGQNSSAVGDLDLDGNPRIQGGTVDMGAYEIQPPPPPPPATTSGTPVPVPYSWLDTYYTILAGAEYETIANGSGANGIPVWQSYVACLNPTNPSSRFVVTGLTFTNGVPYFTWEPNRSDIRDYEIVGGATLDNAGSWGATNPATRFFRVKVLLK